jgi:hypothetical protein
MKVVTFNFDNLLLWFVNLNYLHIWTHHCQLLFDTMSIVKVLINNVGSFIYNNVTYCDTTSCNICTRYKCLNLFPFEAWIYYRIQIWSLKFNVKVISMLQKGCNLQGSSFKSLTHPQAPWWIQLQVQRWRHRKEKELGRAPWLTTHQG